MRDLHTAAVDFRKIFESAPGLFLILQTDAPRFTIVAISDEFTRATMTRRAEITGKPLFDVFPDDPGDPKANGVKKWKASLLKVLATKKPHKMALQKYDIRKPKKEGGAFVVRYWSPLNSPVFDDRGNVVLIMHSVVDVTGQVLSKKREQTSEAKAEKQLVIYNDLLQAQKQIQDSEKEVVNILESMHDAFFSLDKDFKFLRVNHMQEKISQTKRKDTLGKSFWDVFPAVAKPDNKYWSEYHKAMRTRKPVYFIEYYAPLEVWTEVNVYPTREGGIAAFFRDISTRKKLEKELQDKDQQLQSIIDGSPGFVFVKDLEGRFLNINNSFARLMGISNDEIRGRSEYDLITKDHAEVYLEHDRLVMETGTPRQFEETSHFLDGVHELLTYKFPLYDSDGKMYAICCIATDITPLKKLQQELKDKESQLQSIIDGTPGFIFLKDLEGHFLTINKALEKVLGMSREDIRGKTDFDTVAKDQAEVYRVNDKRIADTGIPQQIEESAEMLDGHHDLLNYKFPLYDSKGNMYAICGISTDITAFKKLEQQKDEFIAVASHELKTPVTTIKAYAQVLEHILRQKHDAKTAAYLNKMDQQINKLTLLITDLLDVTRIQSGKLKLRPASFDFNQLVGEVVEQLQLITNDHKITTKFARSRQIFGDRERIGQVINNLIINAIKYSPQAEEVIVSTKGDKTGITLCVQDFGIGIPAEQKDHIFKRFYRVEGEDNDTFPGLGLGLYIASEIVRRHQGRIWCESELGKGSRFFFTLPLKNHEQKD